MNRTKIEWTDFSWNPVTGCKNFCTDLDGKIYCYAWAISKRFHRSFEPTLHPERLKPREKTTDPPRSPYDIKKPVKIFVCSMGELFGYWIPRYWIQQVREVVRECSRHTFIFLTKEPHRLASWSFPSNCWMGVSIDRQASAEARHLALVRNVEGNIRFISFEPLLESIQVDLFGIHWIIIGGMTGPKPFIPPKKWVDALITEARKQRIPVFLKDNLHYPQVIREFPAKYQGL